MKLYNSLTRQLEDFVPLNPPRVGVYTCGPTVYSFVTIGNWRTNFLGDLLVRSLKYLGYEPDYYMNITDVGHLTGDNLGDADTGEDKLQKAARKEKKSAWDVAQHYINAFLKDYKKLNLTEPKKFVRATDHIAEQIEMIQAIEAKGFVYRISDGMYFDVAKYEAAGHTYGQLSNLDQIKEGARVEPNPEKKDPRDFALWKFSYPEGRSFDPSRDESGSRREMEWDSPWGVGFPGWHIECSAMSTKYLGCQFDIHVGGEDLRSTHHPNEIVQSEVATGCVPFVKYWVHGAFLQIDGGRMGKSLGNAYTVSDIEERGYKPEHLRYFYLTGHYRQPLNFTWENLENAKRTYERLVEKLSGIIPSEAEEHSENEVRSMKQEAGSKTKKITQQAQQLNDSFKRILETDLQTPVILADLNNLLKSYLANDEIYYLVQQWDQVLGLNLIQKARKKSEKFEYTGKASGVTIASDKEVEQTIIQLIDEREVARNEKDWEKADQLREMLKSQGYVVEDRDEGVLVRTS